MIRRLAAGALAWLAIAVPAPAAAAPVDLVNPFMGTEASAPDFGTGGGAGNTYPGATAPFGMLNWSPDTDPSTLNFPGGYTYTDSRIKGFSLTHISGAGCAAYQDFPVIATSESIDAAPTKPASADLDSKYLADFSHEQESAEPGYYSVTLDPGTDSAIRAELTADVRAGLGRFRFAPGSEQRFLVNAGGSAMANRLAEVAVDPGAREISGVAESGNFCYQRPWYKVYFAARFDRPFAEHGTWRDTALNPGATSARDTAVDPINYKPIPGGPPNLPGNPSGTAQAGAYVGFDPAGGRTVKVRIGVSFTSVAQARANLEAEVPGFAFDSERREASRRWARALDRIEVSGGQAAHRRTFYSTLYRSLVAPRTFSDASGTYTGMDLKVHEVADGRTHYADFSLWDTYRSQIPLLAMLYPKRAGDIATSLLAGAKQSGCLPKWGYATGQTMVMVGDPAAPALAAIDALGQGGFNRKQALKALLRGADEVCRSPNNGDYVQRQGLADYLYQGFIGYEDNQASGVATSRFGSPDGVWGSSATTLEYATADFAIARFAARSCEESVYERMMERSANWLRVFNPASGYAEPRLSSGGFLPTASPESGDGFAEGSSAQYTWMVPFDPAGLAEALGGRRAAVERLDELFAELNSGPESEHAFLGNEPNLNAPWLYDWFGRPDRTQKIVRDALLDLYSPRFDGYPGNEDLGAMSSWWVFGALGIYPAVPGARQLALGSPLFERARVRLGDATLRIEAPKAGAGRPYVHGLELDGRERAKPWVRLSRAGNGSTLRFDLSARPNRTWGSAPAEAPPSYGPKKPLSGNC